jgi:NAD(P)-dependent dehydrogenase (short-subunit alcohol dehydrogenase family)
MITKTVSIELSRLAPQVIVVGLHPGTVDTDLSQPFQRNVPDGQLQTTQESAASLLSVIDGLTTAGTGRVFDFRGKEIPP